MAELLKTILKVVDEAKQQGATALTPAQLKDFEARYDALVEAGWRSIRSPRNRKANRVSPNNRLRKTCWTGCETTKTLCWIL